MPTTHFPGLHLGCSRRSPRIGEESVRKIYGDFSGTRLKSWPDVLAKHAIKARQNFAYTNGKNASDIALVIDAMDLLHTSRFEGFCLVSSDSDFTGLASRIREQGIDVYGFGEQKTPESFRQTCRRSSTPGTFCPKRRHSMIPGTRKRASRCQAAYRRGTAD